MQKAIRIIAITAALLGIIALSFDKYYWLIHIFGILLSINLIILGVQDYFDNKKSPFAYSMMIIAILIIFISVQRLLF